jgi:hypothetical protein
MSYYSIGNHPEAYKYFVQQLQLIEAIPFLRKNVDNHVLILYDVAYMALLLKKFDDIPALLLKLENLLKQKEKQLTQLTRLNSYFFYYLIKLDSVLHTADFENCSLMLADVENFINAYWQKGYSDFPYLIYTLSTVYFAKGDYGKALFWINKFFNEKDYRNFTEIALGTHILSIFIHYELNNIELLQYKVKSFYHFLLRSKKTYKFEIFLIKFIRRLPKVRSNEDFIVSLRIFKRELESIRNDPFESRVFFEYFDYISWVDSKIENKPLTEILKRKVR